MDRIKQLAAHFSSSKAALSRQSPDDIVVTMAIRSPMCKARKGGFRDARCEDMSQCVLAYYLLYYGGFRTDELMLEMFKVCRNLSIMFELSLTSHAERSFQVQC